MRQFGYFEEILGKDVMQSFVTLTLRIHFIVDALISMIPVGTILLNFKTSCLFPLIVSLLILIRFSIIGEDSMLHCCDVHSNLVLRS
jgi:hypothetical protein